MPEADFVNKTLSTIQSRFTDEEDEDDETHDENQDNHQSKSN